MTELLQSFLQRYTHVETYDPERVKRVIHSKGPEYKNKLIEQLTGAIKHRSITPQEYEQLTDEDFDTQDDLQEWLKELLQVVNGAK